MKASKLIVIFALIVFSAILIYSFSNVKVEDSYITNLEKERVEKDQKLKSGDESPLTQEQKIEFQQLNYYPINREYVVEAQLEINPLKETLRISYTDGSEKLYLKYGYVNFNLQGEEQRLLILKPTFFEDEEYLFLPFYDETSTIETYGGGRYIDLEMETGETIEIDFNRSYNPYCAYNSEYRCPIPPKENKINVPVEAGEKIFELNP